MATSALLSLPEELVAAITHAVEVPDLPRFALTCKEVHRIAKSRLAVNAAYHAQYELQHDRQPLTAPALLRLATAGGDQAWHIRALEFWGARPEWRKWKSIHFDYYQADENWPEQAEDHSNLNESFYTSDELDVYTRIMRDRLHFTEAETLHWRTRTEQGDDEPIKGMLMALAPGLDRVNFIAYDSWQGDDFSDTHPLTFMCLAITRLADVPGALWPPGFHSLRRVSVCQPSNLRHGHDAYYANTSEVFPLFRLPNIKVLMLNLLGYMDDEEPEWEIEPRSSTVEELGFYCCDLEFKKYAKLIRACRSLRRLVSDSGSLEMLQLLADECGGCLEEQIFRVHEPDRFDIAEVGKFRKLRVYECLAVDDLLVQPTLDGACELRRLQDYLPTSIETIMIRSTPRLTTGTEIKDALLRAILNLASDKQYGALKVVCMFNAFNDAQVIPVSSVEPHDGILRQIEEAGVSLHLRKADGELMSWQEHSQLHVSFSSGTLTEIETDPGLPAERNQ